MVDVVLEFCREKGTQLSTGAVVVRQEGAADQQTAAFTHSTFESMIRGFAAELQRHPGARAIFQRTDRSGLQPVVLETKLTTLLNTDVEAAIQSLTYVASPPRPATSKAGPLVVGHDTLAQGFGDHVYCRVRNSHQVEQIECPVCGRWGCARCGSKLQFKVTADRRWAVVPVKDLLTLTPRPARFFLPRAWNNGQNWISYEDLNNKYEQYLKEKNNVR